MKLVTYLLTHLRSSSSIRQEGHTTQIIYNRKDWIEFQYILKSMGTNTNRFLWGIVELVLEEYDKKEHSLDKFIPEPENKKTFDIEKQSLDDAIEWLKTIQSEDILYDIEYKCNVIRSLALAKRRGEPVESLHQGNLQYFRSKYGQ